VRHAASLLGLALFAAIPAQAGLVDPGAFVVAGPTITFGTDADIGVTNPNYVIGGVSVRFAGYFSGQTLAGSFPETFATAVPNAPLALAGTSTILEEAGNTAGSPALGGDPDAYGPVAFLFGRAVPALSFTLGFLDVIGGITVEAFGSDGASLGTRVSSVTGFEQVRIADDAGRGIRGVVVFFNSDLEPAFTLDNLSFVAPRTPVPAPGGILMLVAGLAGLAAARRR